MGDKLSVLESLARSTGNSVIQWAADEIARLTAERADPTQCKRGEPQPARGGLTAEEREASTEAMKCMTKIRRERDEARAECERLRHLLNTKERECETHHPWVHPTEAAPPPRGWLTAEERETVEKCLRHFVRQEIDFLERNDPGHRWLEVWRREEAILRALLARETPPRVRRPNPNVVVTTVDARERIDRQWMAAIREAGGEVEG